MRIAIILSLLIATLAIVFAVINPLAVDINFGLFTIQGASLPLVLIMTLIIGVVIGYLVWLPARITALKKVRALERAAQTPFESQPTAEPLIEPDVGEDGKKIEI